MDPTQARADRRRRIAAITACVFACLTLGAATAQAATIAVDIQSDTVAPDSHCSLREAITSANNNMAPFAGPGECADGAGADVVTLPAGHFTLSRTGAPDDTNVNGDLDVLGAGLTIQGAGAGSTTIDANHIDRVLDVPAGRVLTLKDLTVTGGQAPNGTTGANHTGAAGAEAFGDPAGPGDPGGGIRNAGTLMITNCTISSNHAGSGGTGGAGFGGAGTTGATGTDGAFGGGGNAAVADGGDGGGIYTTGAVTLTGVTLTENTAGTGGHGGTGTGGQGGAGISGNGGNGGGGGGGDGGSGGNGGGIFAAHGATLTIDLSTIRDNRAGTGGVGGLGQGADGGLTTGNGTVGGNGGFAHGGSFAASGGSGGGIYALDDITVMRSLVSGNRAGNGGQGGAATGGKGGHGIDEGGNSATGGDGSTGMGEDGGFPGFGGGIYATGTFTNITVTGNLPGDGGNGGNGTGGNGGQSVGGPTGGKGGNGWAGDAGGGGSGGGLFNFRGTISHATVTANDAGAAGSPGQAIVGSGGTPGGSAGIQLNGSPGFPGGIGGIDGGAQTTLVNSVVAGNAGANCYNGVSLADGGHNFTFPDNTCPGTVVDPQLGPLADNGGPTMTQALLPSSPAIDAAPADQNCPSTDQRGVVRPQGPACDSGAYEVEVAAPSTTPPPGGPTETTNPTPRDMLAPVFLSASIKPATFAVNRSGPAEKPVTSKVSKGTTFRFRLSENARIVVTIERPQAGRRAKSRCVKPTRANRRKARCTRFVVVGRFAVVAKAGGNVKKFSGRIGRRALKPARYRATLIATDAAGNKSKPKRLNLRVIRGSATSR